MKITVDITMYPLVEDYKPEIKGFIRALRACEGLELATNAMSTQVSGDFDAVTAAITHCMKQAMGDGPRVVFVAKYLNTELPVGARLDI